MLSSSAPGGAGVHSRLGRTAIRSRERPRHGPRHSHSTPGAPVARVESSLGASRGSRRPTRRPRRRAGARLHQRRRLPAGRQHRPLARNQRVGSRDVGRRGDPCHALDDRGLPDPLRLLLRAAPLPPARRPRQAADAALHPDPGLCVPGLLRRLPAPSGGDPRARDHGRRAPQRSGLDPGSLSRPLLHGRAVELLAEPARLADDRARVLRPALVRRRARSSGVDAAWESPHPLPVRPVDRVGGPATKQHFTFDMVTGSLLGVLAWVAYLRPALVAADGTAWE